MSWPSLLSIGLSARHAIYKDNKQKQSETSDLPYLSYYPG